MLTAKEPASDVDAYWQECTPDTIPGFSAVAYFFGRELHQQLDVPVGLINTSWGGTRIEPWTPPEGFKAVAAVADLPQEYASREAAYTKAAAAALEKIQDWLPAAEKAAKAGDDIPAPPAWPAGPGPANTLPSRLYNAMVHPLVPFSIRGAIWYQGESNLADGMLYHEKMKALIAGWRAVWHEGDFPFLFVQLATFNYGPRTDTTALPRLWEAQSATLAVPNTGMAVVNDISNVKDIHPKNKQDVGKRLALWALAKTYGQEGLVYSGPAYKSMQVEDGKVRLTFDHVGGGLTSRDGKPLSDFTIAGADKKFAPARAEIEGNTVVVSSPEVKQPAAVRFAWTQTAEPNLSNKEGLPTSSFRTDRW
jgi:sialate O-acetylesterase